MSNADARRVLRIDLGTGETRVDEYGYPFARKYMGGSCLGAYFLLRELAPGIDALSPENLLIFATSPLTGALCPGASAHTVISKSPLSGLIGECVTAGGYFGVEIRKAGYDAIVIRGTARQPCCLVIRDGAIEFRDAAGIWGKSTAESYDRLKDELKGLEPRIALIGPAGENLVRFASIVTDNLYFSSRFGLGAVMGSKKLKAVCVQGSGRLHFADERKIAALAGDFKAHFLDNPLGKAQFSPSGEAGYLASMVEQGLFSTQNFLGSYFSKAGQIDGHSIVREFPTGNSDCFGCFGGCKKQISDTDSIGVDPRFGLIDIETLASCANNLWLEDRAAALQVWNLVCQMGMDGTSLGGVIAFAIECFLHGLIDRDDTDGIQLRWGDARSILELGKKIALRQGIGDLLAEGVKRASSRIHDSESYAIHVKGVELPCHEPRIKQMLGLGYALSPIGPYFSIVEHDTDFDLAADPLYMKKVSPLGLYERMEAETLAEKKVRMFYLLQPAGFSMLESLCCCIFAFSPVRYFDFQQLVELVNAATGWESSLFELWKIGEKRINMFRLFACREGIRQDDDMLPARLFDPIEYGPRAGTRIDLRQFVEARDLYYQLAGWDKNGIPQRPKLLELDLLEMIRG
jgi:aldehyde:ferredoxin oxidoreductase